MPSLLDIIIQNRRGPQGGLLGQNTAPPEASPLAALTGASQGQAASGGGSPTPMPPVNLSPEEQAGIRSNQLLTAGLATLASDPSQGTLGRLARGVLTSQEVGRQSRQDLIEQKIDFQELAVDLREEQRNQLMQRQRARLFSSADLTDPQQRTEVFESLMAAGDFKGAQRLNQFEANIPEVREVQNGEEIILYDPRTLERKGSIQTPDERPEGTQLVNRGTRSDLIDKDTGQVISSFSHELTPQELQDRQSEVFKRTDKLADDFRSETGNLQESLILAEQAAGAPSQDPAAQQTLVIALNKLLDPGSVVRQSEFARVQEIGGFAAEAQTFANRLAEEGQLPPSVENRIRDEIARLRQVNQAKLREIAGQFRDRAESAGVNPDFVVRQGLQEDVGLRDEDDEERDNIFIE